MSNEVELKLQLQTGDSTSPPRQVDICFVFDTTGSMNNKIDGLITCMVDFVRELSTLALNWQISVVPFGDLTVRGDTIVGDNPFVTTSGEAEQLLRTMPRNSGGSNTGESSLEAVDAALAKAYRPDAVKMLILLTDERALLNQQPQLSPDSIKNELLQREFMLFAMTDYGDYFKEWARVTGGAWYPIAAAVDTQAILDVLRQLAARVALVAHRVHALGGGSVREYLALESGADNKN